MLWDWLKKDFAKDAATVKAIGAGVTRANGPSPSGVLPVAALGTVLGVVGELLSSNDDCSFINGQGWPNPTKLGS